MKNATNDANKSFDQKLIDIISEGKVIFNKSEPNQKPCGIYYIETDSLNFIITNCEDSATLEIK